MIFREPSEEQPVRCVVITLKQLLWFVTVNWSFSRKVFWFLMVQVLTTLCWRAQPPHTSSVCVHFNIRAPSGPTQQYVFQLWIPSARSLINISKCWFDPSHYMDYHIKIKITCQTYVVLHLNLDVCMALPFSFCLFFTLNIYRTSFWYFLYASLIGLGISIASCIIVTNSKMKKKT